MTADDLPQVLASLPPVWGERLPDWTVSAQSELVECIRAASGDRAIAPSDPFRALRMVEPEAVKVVVVGQDPYPTRGQADGLAFSAERSTRPSLRRIFDVLENDRPGWRRPTSGRLDSWARQGVLLLNPVLTVEVGRKESHGSVGWQRLTAGLVKALCLRETPPVFLLWGNKAQSFFFDHACAMQGLPERLPDLGFRGIHEVRVKEAQPRQQRPIAQSQSRSGRYLANSPERASLFEGTTRDAPNNLQTSKVLLTRHPSNDFHADFMRDMSHFVATADLIDWWSL